jgi:enoyl-CoA hydratase/carnithine racemase
MNHPLPSGAARSHAPVAEDAVLLREAAAAGVVRLVLNRPAQRNSLSEATLAALQEAFDVLAGEPATRVVILAATGSAFSAGHDLKEITAHRNDADRGRSYFAWLMETCSRLMQTIVRLPKPVIAEVQGIATAAGCQLVASCDLAVAATDARFATPGVDIGLFCSTPMVALTRNVAAKPAMEMLLTGAPIAAEDARRIGLVNRVVPAQRLRAETAALAQIIAAKPTQTVRIGKEAFHRQRELPLAEAYAYASGVMVENLLHRESEEGITAFVERRTPRWEDG